MLCTSPSYSGERQTMLSSGSGRTKDTLSISLMHHHFHGGTDTKERCLDNARALFQQSVPGRTRPLSRMSYQDNFQTRVRLNVASSNFLLSFSSAFKQTPLRCVDAVMCQASLSLLPFPGTNRRLALALFLSSVLRPSFFPTRE